MPRHLEAQLQAPACRRQALIMRVEQVALKEKAGQRQPLGHRTGPTLATADQEARQRQQLLPIRSPGRERYGTAGARTDVGPLIVVAPGRAAGQVEPEAQLGEQRQLPADIDFGPMLALQRFEEREQDRQSTRLNSRSY